MSRILELNRSELTAISTGRWISIGSAVVNLDGVTDLESLRDAAAFAEVGILDLASEWVGYPVVALDDILCGFCCEELGLTDVGNDHRVCAVEKCIDEATAPAATTD